MGILDELTSGPVKAFSIEQMGALADAVNRLIAKQAEIEAAENALKVLKNEEREINQLEIPNMMGSLGFDKITLKDGRALSVKDSIQVSIPAARRPDAYQWLDEHNHGDIIKAELTANFSRGEIEQAEKAQKALAKIGVAADVAESVHAGTLKAWARVELEQGHSLPADLFHIHVVKITTVK
jgi:hypothetical protein